MARPSWVLSSFAPSPFQTLKNNIRLTCLTTNGGLLPPESLMLFPRFSWTGWSWKQRRVDTGEGAWDCRLWGSLLRLLSFGFVFILLKGSLGSSVADKGLLDGLYLSSWNKTRNTVFKNGKWRKKKKNSIRIELYWMEICLTKEGDWTSQTCQTWT